MSLYPLWLRAVLSIAVIFNGSLATAGSMVGMSDASDATTSAIVTDAGAGHCHEGSVAVVDTTAPHATTVHNHDGTPDCCKAGACQCACTHATATVEFVVVPSVIRADTAQPVFAIRDANTQPFARLDRPPIA